MVPSRLRPADTLSVLLAAAMTLQAAGGIVIRGLYRENAWVRSIFLGTDIITLALVVPLLVGALAAARRGSARARLIWLGSVSYAFYNNLYYLGTAYNRFFLVYVVIFVLSFWALVTAVFDGETARLGGLFDVRRARKPVGAIMIAAAAILGVMWVGQYAVYLANGKVPQLIIDTGGVTHAVAMWDLTMIVPPLVLGALWLWKGRPAGAVLSTAMLTECTLVTLVLVVGGPFQERAGVRDAWTMIPLWAAMGAAFLVGAALMLKAVPGRKIPAPAGNTTPGKP